MLCGKGGAFFVSFTRNYREMDVASVCFSVVSGDLSFIFILLCLVSWDAFGVDRVDLPRFEDKLRLTDLNVAL